MTMVHRCVVLCYCIISQEVTKKTKVQELSLLGTQFLTDDSFKSLANTKSLRRLRVEGANSS